MAVFASIVLAGGATLTALGPAAQAAAFDPCAATGNGRLRYTTGTARHLVFAISSGHSSNKVVVTECVKKDRSWEKVSATTGRAGRNGFAEHGDKREGDGKSPTGSYRLSEAFGVRDPGTGLPYRRLRDSGDCWGSTPGQSDYNTYYAGTCHSTDEDLSAIMRRGPYRQAVVIDYNRPKAVDGHGSAIFLHIGGVTPTSGCISIAKPKLRAVMRTLAEGDRIVMGPRTALFGS
jgi:L,D-peptidoglycan transpeptidase YkuD (ErfK/YbiS/YcfS/YnhG family)